jgi:hypothetical protein
MINAILSSVIVATCTTGTSYFGGTKAELTRSYDGGEYRLVAESFKGIDGDGFAGVLADETASSLNAIHMEDGMLYQFDKSELEIFGVYSQPYDAQLDGEFRRLNARGEVVETVKMTCDFID